MKITQNMSLADFDFWSGAEDTKNKLTLNQLNQVERELEAMYPEGMDATDLNDLFRYDDKQVLEMAGYFPIYCQVTAKCGLIKDWEVKNAEELDVIKEAGVDYRALHKFDYIYYETFDETDFMEFVNTRYFTIWSRHAKRKLILHCQGDSAAEDLKDSFSMCEVEEIVNVPADGIDDEEDWEDYEHDFGMIDGFAYDEDDMYDCYDIPVYAIPRICKLILDPNGALDYYDIPESHAINEMNRYLELSDEDIKNIDDFVANLHKAMPDGFTIDWDVESVGSPYFERRPAFGLAMDCVKLRVYPKN